MKCRLYFCSLYTIGKRGGVPHGRNDFSDRTQTFSIETPQKLDMQQVLVQVYDALKEKGYNPISQIVGYILSEDPTYITTHNNARSLIRKIDPREMLKAMVRILFGRISLFSDAPSLYALALPETELPLGGFFRRRPIFIFKCANTSCLFS